MIDSFSAFTARTGETDPLRALSSFVNYSKTELLKNGALTPENEKQVNAGALQKAVDLGLSEAPTTEEDQASLFGALFSDTPSPELYAIQARDYAERGDESSAQKLRAYTALQQPSVKANFGTEEEYQSALESAKVEADPLFNEATAKRYAVRNGLTKVASFVENGNVRVEVADGVGALDDKALAEYAAANPKFVSANHLSAIRDKFAPIEGLGKSKAQLEKTSELESSLVALIKTDPNFAKKLETGTRGFELDNRTGGTKAVERTFGVLTGAAAAVGGGLMEMLGKPVPQTSPLAQTADSIAEDLATNHELGRRYSKEQLKSAVQDMITVRGIDSLDYDEKDPASVARILNNGTVALPTKSIVNKQVFDKIVGSLKVSDFQKDLLRGERTANLDAYAKILMPQIIEAGNEDLLDVINEGKRAGKSDGAIMEEVAASPKYSGALNRLENFGLSVIKTATDLIPAVGAMLPDIIGKPIKDFGFGVNKKISDEMSANAALAGLAGKDFGWAQELSQQVPQLVADIFVSRGAGRAAGAIGKGFGSAFTRLAPATAARMTMFAERGSSSVARQAVKELTEQFMPDASTVGWQVSQGARTFGSTYTSVRSSLESQTNADGSPKYNAEQVDAMATESGLMNAAITNLVTLGFNKIGGGKYAGAETLATGKGFSRRALKQYYDDVVAGTAELPEDIRKIVAARGAVPKFEEFVGSVGKSVLRPFAEGMFGEAAEEYLQTVGEDLVNASATGEEFDLVKTTRNAGFAALLGGVLGGAAKGVEMAETEFMRDPQYRQADFEEMILSKQIKSLRDSGSPMTADFLEKQMGASKAKKQTIRQQYAEHTAERKQVETDYAARQKDLGEVRPVAGPPLGLPAPDLSPEQRSRYDMLSRRHAALERKIAEAEAAVPEDQRTDRQNTRLTNLREARDIAASGIRAVYDYKEATLPTAPAQPAYPMEGGTPVDGPPVITGYVPPALRATPEGAFLERLASQVDEKDAMDDDAVTAAMDEAGLEFGLPETDEDIDTRHSAELRKVVPATTVQRFAKSATNEQRAAFSSAVTESRAAYREYAEHQRLLEIQRQSTVGLEQKIAELELEPSEQKGRIAQKYREQLAYVQRSIAESEAKSVELKNGITDSLSRVRDTVSNTKSYDQLVIAAMEMIDESAAKVASGKKAAKAAGKPAAVAEQEADEALEAEVVAIAETVGTDVAQDAAAAVVRRRAPRAAARAGAPLPAATPAPAAPQVLSSIPPVDPNAPAVLESEQPVADAVRAAENRTLSGVPPVDPNAPAVLESEQPVADAVRAAENRALSGVPPVDPNAPAVLESEQELAGAIRALSPAEPSALDQLIETPEVPPVTEEEVEARKLSAAVIAKLAKVDELMKSGSARKAAESANKALREKLPKVLSTRTVPYTNSKGEEIAVPLLKDPKKKSSFLSDEDYELFHKLLAVGKLPLSITFYNRGLSYKHYEYSRPFFKTLEAEIRKRWPLQPTPPPIAPEHLSRQRDVPIPVTTLKFQSTLNRLQSQLDQLNEALAEFEYAVEVKAGEPAPKTDVARRRRLKKQRDLIEQKLDDWKKRGDVQTRREATLGEVMEEEIKTTARYKREGVNATRPLPLVYNPKTDTIEAVFTNNPEDVALLRNEGYSIKIPTHLLATVNPSIKYNALGYVESVEIPSRARPIYGSGDLREFFDEPFHPEELDTQHQEFIFALPKVPPSMTRTLGATMDNHESTKVNPLTEDDYIQAASNFLAVPGPTTTRIKKALSYAGSAEAVYDEYVAAVMTRYMRMLREFGIAVRVEHALTMNKDVTQLMRGLFMDPQTRTIQSVVRQYLEGRYGSELTDDELLLSYGMQLRNELSESFTTVDDIAEEFEALSDMTPEEMEVSEERAKGRSGKRWAKGKPNNLLTIMEQVQSIYRKAIERRGDVREEGLPDEAGPAMSPVELAQSIITIQTAWENDPFTGSQTPAEQLERESQEIIEYAASMGISQLNAEFSLLKVTQTVVQRVNSDPEARAAFVKLGTAFGLSDAETRPTEELIELLRSEVSAVSVKARKELEPVIAEAVEAGIRYEAESAQPVAQRAARRPVFDHIMKTLVPPLEQRNRMLLERKKVLTNTRTQSTDRAARAKMQAEIDALAEEQREVKEEIRTLEGAAHYAAGLVRGESLDAQVARLENEIARIEAGKASHEAREETLTDALALVANKSLINQAEGFLKKKRALLAQLREGAVRYESLPTPPVTVGAAAETMTEEARRRAHSRAVEEVLLQKMPDPESRRLVGAYIQPIVDFVADLRNMERIDQQLRDRAQASADDSYILPAGGVVMTPEMEKGTYSLIGRGIHGIGAKSYQPPVVSEEEQQRIAADMGSKVGVKGPLATRDSAPVQNPEYLRDLVLRPIPMPDGTPVSHAQLLRYAHTQKLLADQFLREMSTEASPVTRAIAAAKYDQAMRFMQMATDLLAKHGRRKKKFYSGVDFPANFYSVADSTTGVTDAMRDNQRELEALGLLAGNNRSIFEALRRAPKRLQPVAELLLNRPDIISSVNIEIVTMPHTSWAGKYIPSSNTIVINRAKTNGRGVADVLAHELLHAGTHWAIRNPESGGAKALVAKLESLRVKAQEQARRAGYTQLRYTAGLASLDEFITYTFTSPDFQRMLREIDPSRNFVQRFFDGIRNWFSRRFTSVRAADDVVTRALRDMTSLVGRANMRPYGTPLSEDIAADMDAEVLMSVAEEPLPPTPDVEPPAPTEPVDSIRTINDETLIRPMGVRSDMPDTVLVNPTLLAQVTEGMSARDAQAITRKMIAHEVAHLSGLQALTPSDIADVATSLTGSEMWDIADRYYSATVEDKAARYAKIAEDRQSGVLTDEQIVHEFLRMELEKITTGSTTEQDLSFYRSNPNILQRVLRYLGNAIHMLRSRVASPFDSMTAASLNRALRVYQQLNGGDIIASEEDAIAKIADGEVMFLYTAAVPTDYQSRGKWERLFKGEFPDSVKSLVDEKGALNKVAARNAARFDAELRRLVKTGRVSEADGPAIRAAMGSLPEISSETYKKLRAEYDAKLEKTRDAFNKSAGTQEDRDAKDVADALARTEYEAAKDKAYEDADRQIRADMQAARALLPADMVRVIDRWRAAVDADSGKLASNPHLPDQLRVSISNSLGIYTTQSYRAFTTKGWFDMLRSGGVHKVADKTVDFDAIRENALKQYTIQAEQNIRYRLRFSKLSKSVIDAKVRDTVTEEAQQLFDDFISSYSRKGAGLALLHADPTSVWKALMKGEASDVSTHTPHSDELKRNHANLLARKHLPPFIREMLGEVTDPLEVAIRTLATVNTLASNQQFLTKLREQGLAEGWLVDVGVSEETDPAEAKKERAAALAAAREKGYRELRSEDERMRVFNGVYGPVELRDALDHMFLKRNLENEEEAAKAMRYITRSLRNASGTAMGVKTLLSVGARARDFFSDILFFGPMQGAIVNPFNTKKWSAAARSSFSGIQTDEDMEAHISKLIRLGVLDNESNTTALRQMFRAFRDGDDDSLNRIREAMFDVEDSATGWKKMGHKVDPRRALEVAAGVSNTIGSHLKISLFNKELELLNRAYPDRMEADADGLTANEKEASRKVGLTSRTASNVYPIINAISKSGLGSLVAPFITFKAEVARIILSTPQLAFAEINSGNKIESNRGFQRLSGWLFTMSVMPLIVSGMYNTLFALATGDEEDKTADAIGNYFWPRTNEELARDNALRGGLPDWQQGNTVSFSVVGGKVRTLDLTFINPFSVWTDGVTRSIENFRTGEPEKVPSTMLRWFGSNLIGGQILAGSVIEATNNRDDKGFPISISSDPLWKQTFDRISHVAVEAYMPPVVKTGERLVSGTVGSSNAGTPEGRMANRLETLAGEAVGARPRVYNPADLFERAVRKEHAKLRDVRTATAVASSQYPQDMDAIEDAYASRERALVARAQGLKFLSEEYAKIGVPIGEQLRAAREAGVSKKSYVTAISGFAEAPKLSTDDMRAIYEARTNADGPEAGAKALKFLADKQRETGPLIPLNQ